MCDHVSGGGVQCVIGTRDCETTLPVGDDSCVPGYEDMYI